MFNKEFLKTLTVVYVEDDASIRESLGAIFKKVFKEVVMCVDGEDGLEKFKLYKNDLNTPIDAIISDINMPKMNGLKMLAEIRKIDTEVPAILTTAHGETDFLMEAIKVNVLYYALKPINTPELLTNIQKFCLTKHQQKLILRKEQELSSYISIIDQVATIIKIDKDSNFIEVNDLFCEVSLYTKDEIIGKNLMDLTHPDIVSTVYSTMQSIIQNGQTWEGLYKCIDKDDEIFYLRIYAIPEFSNDSDKMTGCVFIGFIATEDEQEKRDTMQKVRQNIMEQKKKEVQLQVKIKQLEAKQNAPQKPQQSNNDSSFIQASLEKYKLKNTKLLNQISHGEKELSLLNNKLNNIAQTEMSKRQELMERNKSLQKDNEILKESLIHTQNQLNKYEKKKI